jgi:methyl-accepting chemotaxis protein
LQVKELSDHTSCRLGKWYHAVDDAQIKANSYFKQLNAPHEQVHSLGLKAANLFASGDLEGAWAAYAEMEKASYQVVELLDKLIVDLN